MSPVDPLSRVVVVRPGQDPERRPTAPPPKKGSGRLAPAPPAPASRPSARPSAAAAAEIEREAQRRRDQAIRDARASRRAAPAPAHIQNVDIEADVTTLDAFPAPAPVTPAAIATASGPDSGSVNQIAGAEPQASPATKLRGPRTPEARARMSTLMKARWAASRQPAAEAVVAEVTAPTPPAIASPAADPPIALQPIPPPLSWPAGAHVVVERLDVRASEVALEVDMAGGFRFRLARSLRPADQSPCVALRLHGVELTNALDPDRARLVASHLLAAADLAAALLAVPESQLAAAVLGGLVVSPA